RPIFEVSDTGRGVAPEAMERIFQPFERIEDPERPVDGTGLGLTITKLLIEMLGGELTVESAPGEGSVFRVKLHLPRGRISARPAAARITGYRGARKSILVVDDNAEHRALIGDLLGPLGFEMRFAPGAAAARKAVASAVPDLILLDVAMPGENGWSLLRALREELGRATPIFMISANAYDQKRVAGGVRSHDAFITKPVSFETLIDALGAHLSLEWERGDAVLTVPSKGISR
ncbi:MAG: response regulator, partial [Pseudomonadota bacterium]